MYVTSHNRHVSPPRPCVHRFPLPIRSIASSKSLWRPVSWLSPGVLVPDLKVLVSAHDEDVFPDPGVLDELWGKEESALAVPRDVERVPEECAPNPPTLARMVRSSVNDLGGSVVAFRRVHRDTSVDAWRENGTVCEVLTKPGRKSDTIAVVELIREVSTETHNLSQLLANRFSVGCQLPVGDGRPHLLPRGW